MDPATLASLCLKTVTRTIIFCFEHEATNFSTPSSARLIADHITQLEQFGFHRLLKDMNIISLPLKPATSDRFTRRLARTSSSSSDHGRCLNWLFKIRRAHDPSHVLGFCLHVYHKINMFLVKVPTPVSCIWPNADWNLIKQSGTNDSLSISNV